VEGYMDVLALTRAGVDNVVAALGTALTDYQARAIGRYADTVDILMDNDRAGRDASLRARDILDKIAIETRFILLKGAKDPDEYISTFGCERLVSALDEKLDATEYQLELLKLDADTVIGMPEADYRNKALDLLSAEPDIVKRELYSGRLAKELQINTRAIREEVERRHNETKSDPRAVSSRQGESRRGDVKGEGRRSLRGHDEDEIFILMMIADNTQLIHVKPKVPKSKLAGYALSGDTDAFLSSERATAPLAASDFRDGFLRQVADLSIKEAKSGGLTLASLHAIVDNTWETYKKKSVDDEREDPSFDVPDLIHAKIGQQFNTYNASERSKASLEGIYLQRLTHLRLWEWEREASFIHKKAGELEMAGSDQEAAEHYAQAAKLTTAAQAFRMITQGENNRE
ncbi:MAG TPA: toprim domain-containing protein, partial [Clostridia bacterium]|nr:toprim domain-containing protein [Clostridia bacterium]